MRRRELMVGTMTAVVIAFAGAAAMAGSRGEGQLSDQSQLAPWLNGWAVVGTWSVQVTLANCQTGEEIPAATLPVLNTFLAGGSMLSDPAANPALLRTGHGVWAYAGGRRFTNTVVVFRFNPDGSYAGTETVRRNITVSRNADEFITHDTATTADPGGAVVATRCAVGRARRLEQ